MPDSFKTPRSLVDAYTNGLIGAYFDPEELEALMSILPNPFFRTAALRLRDTGKGKLSIPFRSVYEVSPDKPYLERQTTGDCVSHGTRNAVDVSRAVQIHVKRILESFVALGATEAIYGSRGHGGQGMSCSGAANFVHKKGGLMIRKNYPGVVDLSKYNASIGSGWGSRGVPANVVEEAKKHPVATVTSIGSIEEARDALANGYGVCCCSGQGFSSKRDSNGFAKPQGSWNHAMAWTACDDTGSEPAFLVQNSWGAFNSGGHPSWGPIPDGSFLIHTDVAEKMLRGNGTFAFSSVKGFPPVELPDYGTIDYL